VNGAFIAQGTHYQLQPKAQSIDSAQSQSNAPHVLPLVRVYLKHGLLEEAAVLLLETAEVQGIPSTVSVCILKFMSLDTGFRVVSEGEQRLGCKVAGSMLRSSRHSVLGAAGSLRVCLQELAAPCGRPL